MRRWLAVLIFLMVMSRAHAEEPALPRGLGFRTAGQSETAKEIREDLWCVHQGVDDTDFDAELKGKLSAMLGAAEQALDGAKSSQRAAKLRDSVEREAARLLTLEQRDELRRRTTIAFAELLMLSSGFSAHDVDADVVAAFGLTAEQTKKIRALLDRVHLRAGENPADALTPAEARRAARAVLSPKQRDMLDAKIEAGLKEAGAKVPATRKSEAGH